MKKQNIFWFYPIIILGVLLIHTNSCKKEENNTPSEPFDKEYFNPNLTYGTVTDVEGNIYKTILIGTTTWMAENLRVTKFNDGKPIPNIIDAEGWAAAYNAPDYCWYNNDSASYKNTYGALYNWSTMQYGQVCPTGWHVPGDPEWTVFENYLITNGFNYDSSTTEKKYAKALASGKNWPLSTVTGAVGNSDYPDKINVTGFSAIPGGYRNSLGVFSNIGIHGEWWSSSLWSRAISYNSGIVFRTSYNRTCGFSIRCIKND